MGKIQKIKQERKRAEVEAQLKKMRLKRRILHWSVSIVLIAIVAIFAYSGITLLVNNYSAGWNAFWSQKPNATISSDYNPKTKTYLKEPAMQIDLSKTYLANVETNDGNFTITLNAKDTPHTVNNFVVLSRDGFYNDTIFHRIIKDFMIQGGDPKGNGTGGPGYKFADEKFSGDYTPGTVAMANSGPNTNGSQFFIMTGDYSGGKLPKSYTIFGKVTQGMDVVQKIAATPVTLSSSGEDSKPTQKVEITKVTITEK